MQSEKFDLQNVLTISIPGSTFKASPGVHLGHLRGQNGAKVGRDHLVEVHGQYLPVVRHEVHDHF